MKIISQYNTIQYNTIQYYTILYNADVLFFSADPLPAPVPQYNNPYEFEVCLNLKTETYFSVIMYNFESLFFLGGGGAAGVD